MPSTSCDRVAGDERPHRHDVLRLEAELHVDEVRKRAQQ
jgi:hypothetical protein